MKYQWNKEINYPYECAGLLTYYFTMAEGGGNQFCSTLDNFVDFPSPKAKEVLAVVGKLKEIAEDVISKLSYEPRELDFLFNSDFSIEGSIGDLVLQMGHRCDGQSPTQEQLLYGLADAVMGDVGEGAVQTQQQLIDLLEKESFSTEQKWNILLVYSRYEEYSQRVWAVLNQAKEIVQRYETILMEYLQAGIMVTKMELEDGGLLNEHLASLKLEDVDIECSVFRFNQTRLMLRKPEEPIFVQSGILVAPFLQIRKEKTYSYARISDRLKSVADKKRLEILALLKKQSYCGQEIAEKVGVSAATVSHHMNSLLSEGFVEIEKKGTKIYYTYHVKEIERFLDRLKEILLG